MARKMKTMDGNTAAAHVSYAFTISCSSFILSVVSIKFPSLVALVIPTFAA